MRFTGLNMSSTKRWTRCIPQSSCLTRQRQGTGRLMRSAPRGTNDFLLQRSSVPEPTGILPQRPKLLLHGRDAANAAGLWEHEALPVVCPRSPSSIDQTLVTSLLLSSLPHTISSLVASTHDPPFKHSDITFRQSYRHSAHLHRCGSGLIDVATISDASAEMGY